METQNDITGPQNAYHVGLIVSDLDDAMTAYGERFSTSFAHHVVNVTYVDAHGSEIRARIRTALSRTGPLHVELIETCPATVWQSEGSHDRVHHTGFWSDDVTRDARRLAARGARVIARGVRPADFAYVQNPDGSVVELISSSARTQILAWAEGTGEDYTEQV